MTNSEIIKKLKSISEVKPNQEWIASNRGDLLLRIKESGVARQKDWMKAPAWLKLNFGFALDIILPHRFINAFGRPAIISIVGALILAGGMSAIGASQGAIPGNILYPVKIVGESIQLSLTGSVENKTRLEMEFAGRRINELNKLAVADKLTTRQLEEKINKVTSKFTENINTVNTHLAKLDQGAEAEKALEVAKDIDKKVIEYKVALNKISGNSATKVKIAEALDQVDEIGDKVLEVMVAKRDEVKDGVSDLEIVEKLNNKIAQATTGIVDENIDGQKEEVEQVFEDAKQLIQTGDFVAALSKITEGKDIIKEIRERMSEEEKSEDVENGEEDDVEETGEDEEVEVLGVESEEESSEKEEDEGAVDSEQEIENNKNEDSLIEVIEED